MSLNAIRSLYPSSSNFVAWLIEDIEVEEKRCALIDASSKTGSRGVESVKTEDPLLLIIDAASKANLEVRGSVVGIDIPDMEDVGERSPLKFESFSSDPESDRRSGNKALTNVTRSAGLITRYGCTSAVSRKDVNDLAGSSFGLERLDFSA